MQNVNKHFIITIVPTYYFKIEFWHITWHTDIEVEGKG